jgi:sirohydrochlorin cobaltochelatase
MNAGRPAYAHAGLLRRRGAFGKIRVAFWKQEPALRHALHGFEADPIFVVPLFMAEGYFTREVIPCELQLTGPCTQRNGRRVFYTRPVGAHPDVADVVEERAVEAGAYGRSVVVILGHGTPRNPCSAETAYRHAERVAGRGHFAAVRVAFIDQAPNIADMLRTRDDTEWVIVPLFMADGWHVSETIPQDLGLTGHTGGGPDAGIRLGRAVGSHPRMVRVIEDLCMETGSFAGIPVCAPID